MTEKSKVVHMRSNTMPNTGEGMPDSLPTDLDAFFISPSKNINDENQKKESVDMMGNDNKNVLLVKIEHLERENNLTRWIIGLLVTVFGIITPILYSMHARSIDSQFNAINSSVNSKFESIQTEFNSINQRLDYQEKINALQIEKEVNKNFNKN